ncbi:nucleoside-diphosphate-sugar epimerase [Sinomonas atrocyanea]|uniref:nucleoside-diphosphate sugar epimerase n=1 Tax=Sinomonas atrocyanea TaxID=37927 RepID=UPI00277ECA20|nr:nucleoside-diphosphate sugar epimerase [Sinomonas atrocyanea]MDP9883589.1 nucleoside-diphosphate-sugar epimerase [Sinomonas atrocyanea]
MTGRDSARMPADLVAAGVRFHRVERGDTRGIGRLLGSGADLMVDLVAYTADHVRALLPVMGEVACPVLISSRAVYLDGSGRHVNGAEPPRFDGPIREDAPTLPPAGDHVDPYTREGYAPCKAAAERAALDSGLPVTVLRPGKVHGPWARNPRTKGIVDRMLDGEPTIRLAEPDTADHLSAAANVAALIGTVAQHPGARVLNAADPDTPTAAEIVRVIAARLAWPGTVVRVAEGDDGAHPWRTPMMLDTTAAQELGYRPLGRAVDLLGHEVDWVRAVRAGTGASAPGS